MIHHEIFTENLSYFIKLLFSQRTINSRNSYAYNQPFTEQVCVCRRKLFLKLNIWKQWNTVISLRQVLALNAPNFVETIIVNYCIVETSIANY